MALLEELGARTGSYDIAIAAATISILIGGILFGVGLGFGLRRMRMLGAEEIGQGMVSAAMVGGLLAFTLLINSTVPSLVPALAATCDSVDNPTGSPYAYYMCNLEAMQNSYRTLSNSLSRAAQITGFASSLQVDIGVVAAQPFFALQSASKELHSASQQAGWQSALAFTEFELADVVRASALSIFLPVGLILRTFFATRKLGAAAMALAIAAYLIYPLLFLHTFTVSKSLAAAAVAQKDIDSFNGEFASIPLLDLDSTAAVRDKINEMSNGDFSSKVQPLFSTSFEAISLANSDLFLYPIIALLISAVCACELYKLLSAPIFLPFFETV